MKKHRHHAGFNSGFLGICAFVIALCYPEVYAEERIDTEVNALARSIAGSNTQKPSAAQIASVEMLARVRKDVEIQHNTAISNDMYAVSEMPVADTLFTRHLSTYCASSVEDGQCPADPLLIFGDVKISSILSGSSYDATRAQAAQDFLSTLLTPLDNSGVANFQGKAKINAAMLAGDPDLKKKYTQALSDEALLSVVRQSFAEMIAKRSSPAPAGKNADPAQSEMQVMEQNAIKRFMNAAWSDDFAQLDSAAMQKELALMQAYENWMSYQRYRQMERVEALLALSVLQNFRGQKNVASTLSSSQNSAALPSSDGSGTADSIVVE